MLEQKVKPAATHARALRDRCPAMMIQPKVTRTRVAKSKIFDLDKDSALAKSSCCRHPSSTLIFRCAAALFCALLLALAVVFFDKIQYACIAFLELVAGLGFWGMVLLGLVNVLCCCFLLPSLIFTLAAGFLYACQPSSVLSLNALRDSRPVYPPILCS